MTLLLVYASMLQVVSFVIGSGEKDANICKMLVNQRDVIGNQLLESKFVEGDTLSDRTKALLGIYRGDAGDVGLELDDLAKRFGDGWEAINPDDVLRFSTGLERISSAVTTSRKDGESDDAPSLASLMADADPTLELSGLFAPAGARPATWMPPDTSGRAEYLSSARQLTVSVSLSTLTRSPGPKMLPTPTPTTNLEPIPILT